MLRYLALVWDAADDLAAAKAARISDRVTHATSLELKYTQRSWRLWCNADISEDQLTSLCDGGVIVGEIFEAIENDVPPADAHFDASRSRKVIQSGGRYLLDAYWGRYIAFLSGDSAGKTYILCEPSGRIPCFHVLWEGLHFYFSNIEDLTLLQLIPLTINWRFIMQALVEPGVSGPCTGLNEVRELAPGQADVIYRDRLITETYWKPGDVARNPSTRDFARAAQTLNRTLDSTVHSTVRRHKKIAVLLSGGIDSSILSVCLARAPSKPHITFLTFYTPGPGGADERPFAQLMVNALGCDWICLPNEVLGSRTVFANRAPTVSPVQHLVALNEHKLIDTALQLGVDAIYDGCCGDALFYESGQHISGDFIRRRGFCPELIKVITDAARLNGRSVWHELRVALRDLRRGAPDQYLEDFLKQSILPSQLTRAVVQSDLYWNRSPWVVGIGGLPPGKQYHIEHLSIPRVAATALRHAACPELVTALFNQPVLTHSLRTPLDMLATGGWTRALAREAFKNDLPDAILRRRDKGLTGLDAARIWKDCRPFAGDYLLDGVLMREGLITKDKLQAPLQGLPSDVSVMEILSCLSIEAWLRQWEEYSKDLNGQPSETIREPATLMVN